MNKETVDLSVIVPHYNDWERCASMIEAIGALDIGGQSELIVVDNGSDSPSKLPEGSKAELLQCTQPGSYAARNVGVKASAGECLVFTDSDCLPDGQWLKEIKEFYGKEGNLHKIVAGNVVMVPNKAGRENIYEAYDCLLGLDQERCVRRGYAVTANLACSRKVYDDVNGFDDKRLSGGDADFVRRAISKGYELVYLKTAIVFHPARSSFSEFDKKSKRVVGGQVRAGRVRTRVMYTLKNIFPPVPAVILILKKEAPVRLKLKALGVFFPFWIMQSKNTWKALLDPSYMAR